jgi:hypothetical protein
MALQRAKVELAQELLCGTKSPSLAVVAAVEAAV